MEGKERCCRYHWLVRGAHSGVFYMKVLFLVRLLKVPENGMGITQHWLHTALSNVILIFKAKYVTLVWL
jgi:hypothetical protein